jgi:hypothetical protein
MINDNIIKNLSTFFYSFYSMIYIYSYIYIHIFFKISYQKYELKIMMMIRGIRNKIKFDKINPCPN